VQLQIQEDYPMNVFSPRKRRFQRRRDGAAAPVPRLRSFVAPLMVAALAGYAVQAHAAPDSEFGVETVSTRADYVSGGDVLVKVTYKHENRNHPLAITLNGRDVSAAFHPGQEPNTLLGLVTGLAVGKNTLHVQGNGSSGIKDETLEITNYPITGPIISGAHDYEFLCETDQFIMPDGSSLGPALDADCSIRPRIDYVYRSTDGTWKPLTSVSQLPADTATTTTTNGLTVPFVVRIDTRSVNRGIYQSAVLFDPTREQSPQPWNPPKAWNRHLVAIHGFGCTGGWYIQGAALGSLPAPVPAAFLDPTRLGQGYAIFANTLQHPSNNCNALLGAETAMMSKETFIESYGVPDHTISHGCSGGSYTSTRYTDIVPGLFDGILISCTFPDPLAIALNALDGHLITHYMTQFPGALTDAQIAAVTGFKSVNAMIALANQAGRTDPVPARQDIPGYVSGVFNPIVPVSLRYDPVNNPHGLRPTTFDWERHITGVDPVTLFALRPYDNVGVQYGLRALNSGAITKSQFLDLNEKIGGYDQDANYVANRTVGDAGAMKRYYESGVEMSGGGGLASIPIMDVSGIYNDDGGYHYQVFHFAARARLAEANGNADNYVMWRGTAVPYQQAWDTIEQWVEAYQADTSNETQRDKVLNDKPEAAVDGCFAPSGQFIAEPQTLSPTPNSQCNTLYPSWEVTRLVAGGPLSLSIMKCQLKPIDARDYSVAFNADELARLARIFPNGVCDWSKPGVSQVPIVPLASVGPAPQNFIGP
jgi:hypothetical protein